MIVQISFLYPIETRFYTEVERQRLRKTVTEILDQLFKTKSPFSVVPKILSYLKDGDLNRLM